MTWDDYRYFLEVARRGSVRAAATRLSVNHATVLRRIASLERRLSARLFDRLPSGYVMTAAGEEILAAAEDMERRAHDIDRAIVGRDARLSGELRVTLPQVLAVSGFMEELAEFARAHPAIRLEIDTSYAVLDITRRQADVAIRLAYAGQSPPGHLIGRRVTPVSQARYRASDGRPGEDRPVLKEVEAEAPGATAIPVVISDVLTQAAALRVGVGVGRLPCFLGDPDPGLRRADDDAPEHYGDLWVLTHRDLGRTPRVRAFTGFAAARFRARRTLFSGLPDA